MRRFMKYFCCLLYILLLKNAFVSGQKRPSSEISINIHPSYICNSTQSYIPYEPQYTPVKRVRLVVHIFGKDDGSGNLQNTPQHREFISSVFNHLKWFYEQPEVMKPHSDKYTHIPDSRIRFHIDTLLFHRNTDDWDFKKYVGVADAKTGDTAYSNGGGSRQANKLYKKYVQENSSITLQQKDSALHIFLVEAHNFHNKGMAESINTKKWVYSIGAFHAYNNGKNHWEPGMLLAHEIGHALGLIHPYDYQQCDDLPLTKKGATNNIMDSWPNEGSAITPCQMGVLHYNLSGKTGKVGETVIKDWCYDHPDSMITITAGDTVFFNADKYFLGDVYIESGATLVVKCTISLPAGAAIYVAEKGALVIDGGTITNICNQNWNGIKLEKRGKIFGIFKRKSKGKLEIKNDGKIEQTASEVVEGKFE